jgi:hypothetical protein
MDGASTGGHGGGLVNIRRLIHRTSLVLALCGALFSAFMLAKVEERNRLLGGLIRTATRGVERTDTDAVVLSLSREIHARSNATIRPEDLPLFERWEATSFFNVGTGVALKYGGYGVAGEQDIGPCGTMTRVLLNACWTLGIPARKLQLEPDDQGRWGGHTMVEFRSRDRWQVISPSDSSFVWRTRDGRIATVDEIRADSTVFAQVFARYPNYPYRFVRPFNIRWAKLPGPVRGAFRAVLGEERYRTAETPRLYDQPRVLFLTTGLGTTVLFAASAWLTRPRRRRAFS